MKITDDSSLQDVLRSLLVLEEYLDKRGYTIAIVKKPRAHSFRRVYDGEMPVDESVVFTGRNTVRRRREALGLSRIQLAKEMGVGHPIVDRMEDENHSHTYKTMKKFADYFGCTVEELQGGGADE